MLMMNVLETMSVETLSETSSEIFAKLCSEIIKLSGVEEVLLESRLWHDIGLRGEDAHELIEFVRCEFDVDVREFDFSAFFPTEGWSFSEIVGFLSSFPKSPKKELTVSGLIDAVQAKKLL
jgi:Protein of unknown function (DUF1493)